MKDAHYKQEQCVHSFFLVIEQKSCVGHFLFTICQHLKLSIVSQTLRFIFQSTELSPCATCVT